MSHAPVHQSRDDRARRNGEWVAALRGGGARARDAHDDLATHIRRGLGRALRGRFDLDDASIDDLTQEAMIQVVTRLDSFRGDSLLTTWAMAIAVRVAYTTMRRRRWGERTLEDLGLTVDAGRPSVASAPPDPAKPADQRDLIDALRDAIDRDLTPRQRAAVLGELAGMPTRVLAEQLDTSANALYKLHHDARMRLRTSLEKRGFPEDEVRRTLDGGSKG